MEKNNKTLMACSLTAFVSVFGGVEIDKVNLGVVSIKNLGDLMNVGLLLVLSYLLWGAYQNWKNSLSALCEEDLENYWCTYLTDLLLKRIKQQGPSFCHVDQTFTKLTDWSLVSAESSWFIYSPGSEKKSGNRCLRVQLQYTDSYNNTSEINHVVHGFKEAELSDQRFDYWFKWITFQPFFRLHILPYLLGGLGWVVVLIHLLLG
ncbi:hypothetical protein ACS0KU_004771 [Vibrio alginolyticus]|uniref:hypothetical protein n=1 Tax=Vibrio TaxID=662 RepID=UPI001EECB127|nr:MULTISPECIES: hypothetical protein [Vibrio]MDW1956423.1 hypothetical protein [Vibrio sp. Vb0562]MDW1998622.1 hypothetical protein [Vibrio sp. 299]